MGFKENQGQVNYAEVAAEIQSFWQAENVFLQSLVERTSEGKDKKDFVFYEGPPSANGKPGIHHLMARTLKDVFCRYKTLQGYRVPRIAGWDTHGLPVELGVEKELGITKDDIGKSVSVAEFNQKCREAVSRYLKDWQQLTEQMGYWVNMDQAYMTCSDSYIESVWWLVSEIHRKGYLYKGYSIQPYSPGAGTALSSHELNQPGCYRITKDLSCVVQFPLTSSASLAKLSTWDFGEQSISILAWTTTPWTLPANCALCVHKDRDYVLVGTWQRYTKERIFVILASESVGTYFDGEALDPKNFTDSFSDNQVAQGSDKYVIFAEFKGADLVGLTYDPPFAQAEGKGKFYEVVSDDFVTTGEGTGIVHLAPCYGADDHRVCQREGIGALNIVNAKGQYHGWVDSYGGRYIKEIYDPLSEAQEGSSLDFDITMDLKKRGRAFQIRKIQHSYPHCWRTDVPIIYRPVDSWFIRTTAVKDKLVALNKTINWYPAKTGTSRFADWLENLVDWNLSRSRYWGTPLPIWSRKDGREYKVISSVEELKAEVDKAVAQGLMTEAEVSFPLDLHRTSLDSIVLCDSGGGPMYRENDVMDVWFDSGAMPYAAIHHPFDGVPLRFPADFIAEGVDQTRGWFFSLHVIGALCFDSVAYRNVLASGLVLDKHGRKMSKRLGNTVDPFAVMSEFGADVVRWYMMANAKPWENLKFDLAGITECSHKFFNTLFQTYQFFSVYANLDGFKPEDFSLSLVREHISEVLFAGDAEVSLATLCDRWLISELQELIISVMAAMDEYDPTTATRNIQSFTVDKLSNWYVRSNRRRFWKSSATKHSGYCTLWYALYTLGHLAAPFAPMVSDKLYGDLTGDQHNGRQDSDRPISVHLSRFPQACEQWIQQDLAKRMDDARKISSLVLSLREKAEIRVRQPLGCLYLVDFKDASGESLIAKLGELAQLICHETNIKSIERIDPADTMLTRVIKPHYPRLGKRFGPLMKDISQRLHSLSHEEITQLQQGGFVEWQMDGTEGTEGTEGAEGTVRIDSQDVIITYKDHQQLMMASHGDLTVALNTEITEELKHEGMIRELVNRLQNLRKSHGLAISDRIHVTLSDHPDLAQALDYGSGYFKSEVLCSELHLVDPSKVPSPHNSVSIEAMELKVAIQKVSETI